MISFGNEAKDLREPMRPQSPSSQSPSNFGTQTSQFAAAPQSQASKIAVLGPTLKFKGELSAEEDFVLQGSLEGSISNPQCVTIGTEGSVVGDIRARVITIDGQIEGDLYGAESVVVHQTGRVTGNIFAPRVGIVEGAYFSGRVEMQKQGAQRPSQPQPQQHQQARVPSQISPGVALSPEETEKVLMKK